MDVDKKRAPPGRSLSVEYFQHKDTRETRTSQPPHVPRRKVDKKRKRMQMQKTGEQWEWLLAGWIACKAVH